MKIKILAFILFLGFSSGAFSQEEKSDWKAWYNTFLKSLKYKVEKKLSPRSKITAVAAVRGSKQEDGAAQPYWKGANSKKAQEKIDAERKILKDAIETIVAGDIEKGRSELKEFIEKNPNSYFIAEAKEALSRLPESETNAPVEELKKQGEEVKKEEAVVKPQEKSEKNSAKPAEADKKEVQEKK